VDAPDRERDPGALQGFPPGEDVLVDAVDQRTVEVKEERGGWPGGVAVPFGIEAGRR
jgi:hypothetical protein